MHIAGKDIDNIDQLVAVMEAQLAAFDRRRDHRAAFLRVYTRMTRRVRERLRTRFFADPAWIERVAIRFAAYYFAALRAFDAGAPCPPAWQAAFAAAAARRTYVLQDVLLGMNAHINNDLPQVLADILAAERDWPDLARLKRRRFDHDQINRVLHELIPIVEQEVAPRDARLLRSLGRILGRLDELLTTYGLKYYRDHVWYRGEFLLAAPTAGAREVVRHFVEADALTLARRIAALTPCWARPLAPVLRRLRLL